MLSQCGSTSSLTQTWTISTNTVRPRRVESKKMSHYFAWRMRLFIFFFSRAIGHFTAMVNDKSTAVGCGYSTFKTLINSKQFNSYLFACNYASTNIIGCPVYKSGNKGSSCVGGTDNIFNGLCKSTESIDANLLCWNKITVGVENFRWKFNWTKINVVG